MNKDIKQVRKSISKRKRDKTGISNSKINRNFSTATFPHDEEKHGYAPFSPITDSSKSVKDTFVASLMMKSILAAVMFFGVALFVGNDIDWLQQPKEWTSMALTEEFPFASVNHWYQEKFGYPLALTPSQEDQVNQQGQALPVNGTVSQSFKTNGRGILIQTKETSKVVAIDKGTVIFAGNDTKTNKTVIVQHRDGSNTIYGNLSSIDVYQYQFIASNEVIGEFIPTETNSNVYFAIEKNNQFLDPVKVIEVDERP
ncbi:peptidoglycan DD-metalloendopeptidase family protein [Aquibacillus halophilus]|uniref:Peptidoglycan DD-metalloendopeptidase family protein n=1 Tax=Aquibacillus halophilus TaxID=930132 RepID=A0A6A8DCI2_9BACI|nr:M23 family metallopeptidase [Aquibacillus halophilus]MRH42980.1 peptidoglycan DD-metalloendopeptidase family protein [Aquibacillus halophilus]